MLHVNHMRKDCLEQFLSGGSAVRVLLQTGRNEISKQRRPLVARSETRRRTIRNHEDGLGWRGTNEGNAHGVDVGIGRLTFGELDRRNAQRPNVRLSVTVSGDHIPFRCTIFPE